MSHTHPTDSSPQRIWRKVLASFSLEWLVIVPDLYRLIKQWLAREHEGMYEILDYDSSLELVDSSGKTAIFKKQQQVKFLQDYIIAFQDYAWGDGQIFASYHCSPGEVVDRYQDGDRWNILISLRETKSAGDITDFHIERTAKNGFTKAEESLQTEIRHPTKRLKMSIIFPKDRPCQRAVLVQRSQHQTTPLRPEQFTTLPDGRQRLSWETEKIKRFEIYTIKWSW